MPWLDDGGMQCDTCPKILLRRGDKNETIAQALALKWGVGIGVTLADEPYVHIICTACRSETKKRPARKVQVPDGQPLEGLW